jgi:hypothetical protein
MLKSMTAVAIIGPRVQETTDKEPNKVLLSNIIMVLDKKYTREGYYIVTCGCDLGFGKDVFNYGNTNKLKLVQLDCFLFAPYNKEIKLPFCGEQDFYDIYRSRYAGILELCAEFHIKLYYKASMVDDIVKRVRETNKPYHLYDCYNSLIEHRGDLLGLKVE